MEFKKYDNTTQIVSLPGGVKRMEFEIKDDSMNPQIKNYHTYNKKLTQDYGSKITCIPNKQVVDDNDNRTKLSSRRYQTSDIFNQNQYQSQNQQQQQVYNSFKTCNKRIDNKRHIESQDEKKLIPNPKASRPNNIRNPFSSQITIG